MNIEIECSICKTKILRRKGEVNRNAKIGRKTYCSLRCSGIGNSDNIPQELRGDISKLIPYNRYDEHSMFRVFMRRIRVRKNKECNLTLQDLKEQWEKQNGVCPYTGWKMVTPKHTGDTNIRSIKVASLDRIDSSKGYIKGNIEYVSFMAQIAKNNFTKEDVIEFCEAVAKNCG